MGLRFHMTPITLESGSRPLLAAACGVSVSALPVLSLWVCTSTSSGSLRARRFSYTPRIAPRFLVRSLPITTRTLVISPSVLVPTILSLSNTMKKLTWIALASCSRLPVSTMDTRVSERVLLCSATTIVVAATSTRVV
eukprot:Rmarinus@m.19537